MKYPYGYCGMPCALCSRYRTTGTSRCPGCSCDGYYTDVCRVHHCCRGRGLDHCASCGEYPCARLGKMGDFRDLDTGNVKRRTGEAVSEHGFDAWYAEYAERAGLLTEALAKYNDGRMKRWLCELFIKQDIALLREIMSRAAALCGTPRENGKAFREIADALTRRY